MSEKSIGLRILLTLCVCGLFIDPRYGIIGEYRGIKIYWVYLLPALIAIWFWR